MFNLQVGDTITVSRSGDTPESGTVTSITPGNVDTCKLYATVQGHDWRIQMLFEIEALAMEGGAMILRTMYTRYFVHCRVEWADDWDCICNDDCPECGHEIEPYAASANGEEPELLVSEDFEPEDGLPEGCKSVQDLEGCGARG